MARIGLNVPAGLTVTTACCAAYNELGKQNVVLSEVSRAECVNTK